MGKKIKLEPKWAASVNYKLGDSTISEVPIITKGRIAFDLTSTDAKVFDFSKSNSYTKFLFIQTPKKTRGVYMTFIADELYIKGDRKKLHNNQFRKKEKDFSGLVLYHSMKGVFLNGYRYENGYVVGVIQAGKIPVFDKKKWKGVNASTYTPANCSSYPITTYYEQCTDWYVNGTFDGTSCAYTSQTSYINVCSFGSGGGGGGGNPPTDPGPADPCEIGVSSVSSEHPSVSYTEGNPPCEANDPPPTDIINDVDNPCLKAAVKTAIDNGVLFGVNYSLCTIFDNNDDINLYFADEALAPGEAGVTRIRYDFVHTDGKRNLGIDVTLNTLYSTASKEYNVSTVIHEGMHAYFSYRNSLGQLDHTLIAQQYINQFKSIMKNIFPNIDNDTNNALAWEGLGETAVWSAKSNLEKNHIVGINDAHRSGSAGQTCP